MKLMPRLSLVCLLVTLPLLAQTPAPVVINAVEPAAGPTAGGTIVTITGSALSLPDNFACILPCPTTVRFGSSAEVPVLSEEQTRITVRTPAHAAGTVDVTVRTGDGRSATKPDAFTFVHDAEPGYTSLLLPVYLDGTVAGDRGSLWKTEFWIRNNSTKDVQLAPWDCPAGQVCPAVVPLTRTLRPGENLRNLPAFFLPPSSNVGRMLYVTRTDAQAVATSLRVWDTSRDMLDAGAEIPVIREEEMLTTLASLMSIPLNQNFRLQLRVYDVAQKESVFRVRIFAQEEGVIAGAVPLREFDLTATATEEGSYRVRPAYAEYTDFAGLLDLDIPLSRIRIEVEPRTAGSLFWAFVSITNNETQRLTIVTP
ncbi:MAG TPA: IPT/TIG domain-containing protein [Thermoanaerobaculia bacterium]|nr:IPT/TIG domain-containing protein [Thermoanaerobaculia bacterium]